jgi:hypothetical protein
VKNAVIIKSPKNLYWILAIILLCSGTRNN